MPDSRFDPTAPSPVARCRVGGHAEGSFLTRIEGCRGLLRRASMRAVPAGDNMAQHVYTVKRSFLVPLGVDVLLLLCLFVLSLLTGSATERLVFGIFFFPAQYLLLEGILRRVTLD